MVAEDPEVSLRTTGELFKAKGFIRVTCINIIINRLTGLRQKVSVFNYCDVTRVEKSYE